MQGIKTMLSRRALVLLAATTLGVLGMTGVASAATFTVNDTGDYALANPADTNCVSTHTGTCTLRAAVQAANNNGAANAINLPAGTYNLTMGNLEVNTPNGGTNITISGGGSGSTIIDGQNNDNIFYVDAGGGLSLNGMTLQDGYTYYGNGGAIYSDGALSVTADVVFKGNTGFDGGAIYSDSDTGSSLSLTGASFVQNQALDAAGAIFDASPNTAAISHSTFTSNLIFPIPYFNEGCGYGCNGVTYGGAILGAGGAGGMNLDSSSFTTNGAGEGGAVYWDNSSQVNITNSSFTGNDASTSFFYLCYFGCAGTNGQKSGSILNQFGAVGGAILDDYSGGMNLTGDHLSGNTAQAGGGVYLDSSNGNYVLNQDEFDGNQGQLVGGAVYWDAGNLSSGVAPASGGTPPYGSSFINNSASEGAGMFLDNGNSNDLFTLVNATIDGNGSQSEGGGGITVVTTTPATLTNDTIAHNAGGTGVYGAQYFVTSNGGTATGSGVENTAIANNIGGDCVSPFSAAFDSGNNLDSDGTCFGGLGASGDKTSVGDAKLGQPADNGGPVLTDAELAGSPAIDGGSNTNCPATDARGVTRPQGASCDIGAFEAAAANLSLAKTAPGSTVTGQAFSYTLTLGNGGPGYSTGTTVSDQLPAGETLYAANPSQGTCTSSGSPAKVTCDLGNVNNGSGATVSLVVSEANPGTFTNHAAATNNEGSVVFASATTQIASSASKGGTKPTAITGPSRNVKSTSAKITGTVRTGGIGTSYFFQYGKSKKYGLSTTLRSLSTSGNVAAFPGGLKPNTVYHYRLVATNSNGTSYGRDRTFKTKGHVFLGALILDSHRLHVRNGNVYAPFTCKSSKACTFRISIVIHAKLTNGHTGTLVFTKSATRLHTIGAHQTVTEVLGTQPASLSVLQSSSTGTLTGKLTTRPRTNQRGIITYVTLVNG
jgi:uncharacterized repeat protein (TIGR01451 family)